MVENKVYSFQKMNKDLSESKNPESLYFDAKNLRFISNSCAIALAFTTIKTVSTILFKVFIDIFFFITIQM